MRFLIAVLLVGGLVGEFAEAQYRTRKNTNPSRNSDFYGNYSGSREIASYGEQYELHLSDLEGSYRSYKDTSDGPSYSRFAARGALSRIVMRQVQVGGELGFVSLSGGNAKISYFELIGFGTYNFDSNLDESFYAKGGLGLYAVRKDSPDNGEYENKIGLFFGAGKRFPLWRKVHYSPEIRLTKRGSLDFELSLHFANFSVMF